MNGDLVRGLFKQESSAYQSMPWLVALYQHFRCSRNRSFGVWRLIVLVARVRKKWQRFPAKGPDQRVFYLDLSDVGHLAYLGNGDVASFETLERELACRVVSPDSVVLDIGANIGVWTRSLAQYVPSGQVYAFEPSAKTFDLLQANTQGFHNIEIVNLALSDIEGQMGLSGGPSVFRRLSNQLGSAREIVNVTTLDRWAETTGLARLDFIKMDVEGAETRVLLGAERTLRRFHPTILFEQAPQNAVHFADAGLDRCVRILSPLGYSLNRIMQDGRLSPDLEYDEKTTSSIWAVATT